MPLHKRSAKVLVAGDTKGNLARLMRSAGNAHTKAGPFDALLCVGTFFGEGTRAALIPYLTGKALVPVPTFFICGAEPGELPVALPDEGCEICQNLTYLGRRGTREIAGLTVAYLSGVHDPLRYAVPRDPAGAGVAGADELSFDAAYRSEDVEWLSAACGTADVLLTAEWGQGCDALLSPSPLPADSSSGPGTLLSEPIGGVMKVSNPISSLSTCRRRSFRLVRLWILWRATHLSRTTVRNLPLRRQRPTVSPRYHFGGSSDTLHLALPPYRNGQPQGCTRFYGMAACGNGAKAKALQALNVKLRSPLQSVADREAATALYAAATENPYAARRAAPAAAGVAGAAAGPGPAAAQVGPLAGGAAASVSTFLAFVACIGSPCLRDCVHGASTGGGGGGGGGAEAGAGRGRPSATAETVRRGAGVVSCWLLGFQYCVLCRALARRRSS
jgi:hypothetical protein